MATGPTYRVGYRRKRESKTNYKSRIKMLKSGLTRLVVRPSNKHILVQLVNYGEEGDKVEVTAKSTELGKHGWAHATGNLPAAYLTGFICGLKAKQKNVNEAILDFGMNVSAGSSRIYAALKGALDAGLDVKHDEKMLPSEERLSGAHITSYVEKSKNMVSDVANIKKKIENDLKK